MASASTKYKSARSESKSLNHRSETYTIEEFQAYLSEVPSTTTVAMRILCLHGVGTNGAIFDSQTVSFRSLLPTDWEWVFIDGEEDSDPAPGIDDIYPGPYLAYYMDPSPENLQNALEVVEDAISEEGPFDAIMGFSQGGNIAASLILKHQFENPYDSPLFRFAIFCCSSLPYSWDSEHGFDVTTLTLVGQGTNTDFRHWQRITGEKAVLSEECINSLPLQQRKLGLQRLRGAQQTREQNPSTYRRFHPEADRERIQIPTIHVYGAQDEFKEQSLAAMGLCDERLIEQVQHPRGHEVPREASRDIAAAIHKTARRAGFMI